MKNIQARIDRSVGTMLDELHGIVAELAVDAIAQKMQGRGGRGGRRRSAEQQHRKPEEIAALCDDLYRQICRTPGETMVELAERVGQSASVLAVPKRKLLATGRIKRAGQRQFTRYFPVGAEAKRGRRRKRR